ncbi:MAG: periplasmic heavy metal sensor [Desulforegulaceae bacterium]|nr:periplasmic heavy metal sensor [Desulforegulaceae bacterium]
MKKTLIIMTITGLMTAIITSSSFAMRHGGGQGYMGKKSYDCFNNLTAEEQTALKAEKIKFFKETKTLRTQIFNKKMDLEQEFMNENIDSQKVKNLRSEIFTLGNELSEKRIAHLERINEIIPGFNDCRMLDGHRHHKFRGNGGCREFMGVSYNQ